MTWPTRTVAMPRSLATATSAAVTARTCVTPPARALDRRRVRDRLDAVDDQQAGADGVDVGEHRGEVGLGGQPQVRVERAGALGPQPHLRRRLLAGDVERRVAPAGGLGGQRQAQRALADAGLAGQQDDGTGDEAAAEDAVELARCRWAGTVAAAHVDLVDRPGGGRHRARGDRHPGRPDLGDGAPGLALRALPEPLRDGQAALGAAVRRAFLGSGASHGRGR